MPHPQQQHGANAPTARAVAPLATALRVSLDGKNVITLKDGSSRIPRRGAGAFDLVASAPISRMPTADEKLIAVLTDSSERVVKQVAFVVDARRASVRMTVPDTGTYRLEIWSGTQFLAGNTFVAAALPTLDGMRALELHQDAAPKLELSASSAVAWSHWDSAETDEAYIAEWWHDNKRTSVAGSERSTFQRDVLAEIAVATSPDAFVDRPVWRFVTERFPVPDNVARQPGPWELRIYRDNHPTLALGFSVYANGVVRSAAAGRVHAKNRIELDVTRPTNAPDRSRDLAKIPHEKPTQTAAGLPVTVAEIRGLTRSEILRSQRAMLNQSSDAELVPQMRQLISQVGKPWTDSERPN
ncbi:MAG TPA: hypothetical protein VGM39_15415 [Kofleriaceae bacterium]